MTLSIHSGTLVPLIVISIIMNVPEDICRAICSAATGPDGHKKLPCASALQIAADYKINPQEIGRLCNSLNIKISNCQLGCFK